MTLARLVIYWTCSGLAATTLATASGWVAPGGTALPWLFAASAFAGVILGILVSRARNVPGRRARALRVAEIVAFNAVAALALGEVTLRILQHHVPNQLLWSESTGASRVVAQRRCWAPEHFRYPCNSRGYPDEEFFEPGPRDYSVALLADSFGVGAVPWSYNFATIAERELREALADRHERVAIDNFGVSGINLPGYRHLLDTEVRGRSYAQVALAFFVGNDLGFLPPMEGPLDRLLRVQTWVVPEFVRRSWIVARGVGWKPEPARELEDEPAFLHDPRFEEPSFSAVDFLEIELRRMRYTLKRGPASQAIYRRAFRRLDAIHDELGSRLLLVLIPDEFQVNDALWSALLPHALENYAQARPPEEAIESFDREHPQRRLRAWAEERGVRVLDLLPALREAERDARTYHLRDTHWNAHGNRVAGRELGAALKAYALD